MHDALSIECPHCGETFSLALDTSEGSADAARQGEDGMTSGHGPEDRLPWVPAGKRQSQFTVDCEVCCRPMTVSVRISSDGELEGADVTEE